MMKNSSMRVKLLYSEKKLKVKNSETTKWFGWGFAIRLIKTFKTFPFSSHLKNFQEELQSVQ